MAKATAYRLSEITRRQIEELARYYGNRTTIVTLAIDRFWRETMSEKNITVKSIETKPERDPYHRMTGGLTRSEVWLDPQARVCAVYQARDTRSTTGRIYHGIELTAAARHCDADQLREALEGEAYQSLLRRVCDGHEIVWDGQNHRGNLSEDARDAWDELRCNLENDWDDDYEYSGVEGYLDALSPSEWIPDLAGDSWADATDEQLAALAAQITRDCEEQDLILTGDPVADVLESLRREAQEQREYAAED